MKLAEAIKFAKSVKVEHARTFAAHVVPEVVKPARVIWNQAIGGIFVLFALLFFGYAVKYFRALHSDTANPVALSFAAFLGAVMLFFGIGSFRKARRIAQR
jgi:uncharacterized membrane protein YcjF (UPF0283 family)